MDIIFVNQRLHVSTSLYGPLVAVGGLGTLLGAIGAGFLSKKVKPGQCNCTKNTLFDEKMGGTVHLALGASIPKLGVSINRRCIGIWFAICAEVVKFALMVNYSRKMANL